MHIETEMAGTKNAFFMLIRYGYEIWDPFISEPIFYCVIIQRENTSSYKKGPRTKVRVRYKIRGGKIKKSGNKSEIIFFSGDLFKVKLSST